MLETIHQKQKLEEAFYWTNTLLEWQNQGFQKHVQMVSSDWWEIAHFTGVFLATDESAKSSENKIELDHLEHSWKDELEITAEAKLNQNIIPKKDGETEGFKSRKKSKKAKMRDRKQLSFDDE